LEYCQLPSLVGERLFSEMDIGFENTNDISFIQTITDIFVSSMDDKMKLTFNM
jgi:hypothetical protein